MLIEVNPCWMSIYDCYDAGCLIWNATSISIVIDDSGCKVQIKRYRRLGWVSFVTWICLRDTVITVSIQVVLKIHLYTINRSFNSEYFLKNTSIHCSASSSPCSKAWHFYCINVYILSMIFLLINKLPAKCFLAYCTRAWLRLAFHHSFTISLKTSLVFWVTQALWQANLFREKVD